MLGRQAIDQRHGFGEIAHQDDRAIGVPAGAGDRTGGQRRDLALDRGGDGIGEGRVIGEEDRLAGRIMFRLAEQIRGGPFRIVAAIGDDDDFRWTGHHVDADDAVKLALGFGDPSIAGAGDDVHGPDPTGAISERGDRLRAADAPDFLDPRDLRGGENQRVDLAIGGRPPGT